MINKKIFINGKFLSQKTTGVQRYALQLLLELDHLAGLENIDSFKIKFIIVVPNNIYPNYINIFNNIEMRITKYNSSVFWEQIVLPFISSNCLLLNLCNTAPLYKFNQITTIHDVSPIVYPRAFSFFFFLYYKILFYSYGFLNIKILTVSNFSKFQILKYIPTIQESNITVIPNGAEHLNLIKDDNDVLEEFALIGKKYFLIVGSMNPLKNISKLSKIININYSNSDFIFVFVGSSNSKIFSSSSFFITNNIIFTGFISDAKLKALYLGCSALIFPSLYEGFGIPLLEAVTLNCPILASDIPSTREVCGDLPIYFNPMDDFDICTKLSMFMDDKILSMRIAKVKEPSKVISRDDIITTYNWNASAKLLLSFIKRNFN
jgi:glycosyltransferase involved in cell wall biosynthesis